MCGVEAEFPIRNHNPHSCDLFAFPTGVGKSCEKRFEVLKQQRHFSRECELGRDYPSHFSPILVFRKANSYDENWWRAQGHHGPNQNFCLWLGNKHFPLRELRNGLDSSDSSLFSRNRQEGNRIKKCWENIVYPKARAYTGRS